MSFKIVDRNVSVDTRKDIDKDVKNKWFWNWLFEKSLNDDYLAEYVRKISQPEVTICTWCKELLHYS